MPASGTIHGAAYTKKIAQRHAAVEPLLKEIGAESAEFKKAAVAYLGRKDGFATVEQAEAKAQPLLELLAKKSAELDIPGFLQKLEATMTKVGVSQWIRGA